MRFGCWERWLSVVILAAGTAGCASSTSTVTVTVAAPTTQAISPSIPQTTKVAPVTASAALSAMREQMQIGLGGGTNDGCWGLIDGWDRSTPVFAVNSPLGGRSSAAVGGRLQLCAAGFDPGSPVEVSVTGPKGFGLSLTVTLSARAKQPAAVRLDGFVFGTGPRSEATLTSSDNRIYSSDFGAAATDMSPAADVGAYTLKASQGTRSSVTSVVLGARTRTGSGAEPIVLDGPRGVTEIVVAGDPGGSVDVGLYSQRGVAAAEPGKSILNLVLALPRISLDARGLGSLHLEKSAVPPGNYCVLSPMSEWCVTNVLAV